MIRHAFFKSQIDVITNLYGSLIVSGASHTYNVHVCGDRRKTAAEWPIRLVLQNDEQWSGWGHVGSGKLSPNHISS